MITDSLTVPTLLVDEERCRANVGRMVAKAEQHGLRLRPHFKTHQSLTVGRWLREEGVSHATVSSLRMAKYFAPEWPDITVAFPFNIHELETAKSLADTNKLGLTVENEVALRVIEKKIADPVRVWVKVDTGYHRTGVPASDIARIKSLLQRVAEHPHHIPAGVLIHAGHTYDVHGVSAVAQIHAETMAAVATLREALLPDFPDLDFSIGDTPSCSLMDNFEGATEIRPGNFVVYDVMQHFIGSNALEDIAVCMASPVVAKHPERNHVVVYGGGVHFSKDATQDLLGNKVLGLPVLLTEDGWGAPIPEGRVVKLSQEHGIIYLPDAAFEQVKIGGWLGVLPVHSCLTADLMGSYLSLDGKLVDHLMAHRR